MLIKRIFLIQALLLVLLTFACAVDNCTFNNNYFNQKQLENNTLIDVFKWYPETKELKAILTNGNLLSVKFWSCNHYGKQAVMVMGPSLQKIPDLLNEKVLQLGKIVLNPSELKLLSNTISGKKLKLPESTFKLRIDSNNFDEFYLLISVVNESIVIEIKLYKT